MVIGQLQAITLPNHNLMFPVSITYLTANSTMVSKGNLPIHFVSVLPAKHFISSDPIIACSENVNSSYSGIASFTKKQQFNSSFGTNVRRKYRWNPTFPRNQNCVCVCDSDAHDSSHVQFSHFIIGGKQYCWDLYLAPSHDGPVPSAYKSI